MRNKIIIKLYYYQGISQNIKVMYLFSFTIKYEDYMSVKMYSIIAKPLFSSFYPIKVLNIILKQLASLHDHIQVFGILSYF